MDLEKMVEKIRNLLNEYRTLIVKTNGDLRPGHT